MKTAEERGAEAISWLLRGIDPKKITPVEVAKLDATSTGNAVLRCLAMMQWLNTTLAALDDKATTPAVRADLEKRVGKLWAQHMGQTDRAGMKARRLAYVLGVVATAERDVTPEVAEYLFVRLLGVSEGRAVGKVNAATLAIVHEWVASSNRGAGAPRAGDRRRPKWAVFAALHKALGFGNIDPKDARRECLPSRRRNRRT
jgi:hypothetical protein